MSATAAFRALGDEVRLSILDDVALNSPCRLGEIGKGMNLTRQGIRKHLRVLEEAELIRLEPTGREMRVHLNSAGLKTCQDHLREVEQRWNNRLRSLKAYVEAEMEDHA